MMKNSSLIRIHLVLILLLGIFATNAQTNLSVAYENIPGIPDFLNICGDADTAVILINTTGTVSGVRSEIEATLNLFNGIEFQGLDLANTSSGVTVVDNTNPSKPIFSIPDISPGDAAIKIAFLLTSNCSTIDSLDANNAAEIKDQWDFSYSLGGNSLNESHETVEYRDALAIPFFVIESATPNVVGRVGSCYDREFTITNSGLDGFVDHVTYRNTQQSGITLNSVTVNGTPIELTKTIELGTGDTIYTAQIAGSFFVDNKVGANNGNGDMFFDPNESVTVIENFCILDCDNPRSSNHEVLFGCVVDDYCLSNFVQGFVQLGQGDANVQISPGGSTASVNAGYCQTGISVITFANNGVEQDVNFGAMMDVNLGIGLGDGFDLSNGGFEITGYTIAGVNVPAISSIIALDNNPLFNVDPDGVGGLDDLDNDGFFDDLPIGNSVEIVATYEFQCAQANSTLDNCLNDFSTSFKARSIYTDKCGESVTVNNNNFFSPINKNNDVDNYSTTDADALGDVFYISHFEDRTVRNFEGKCGANQSLELRIILPTGVNYDNSLSTLHLGVNSSPIPVLSQTVNNDTLIVNYDISTLPFIGGLYKFKLAFSADCNVNIGPSSFPTKVLVNCPDCNCSHTWYCGDVPGPYIHKSAPPCPNDIALRCLDGIKAVGFEVNRTTFGFQDLAYTIPFDPNLANRKVAVSCDSVEMIATSVVGETAISDSLGLIINYDNQDNSDDITDIFSFGRGYVLITSGGTTQSCPISASDLNVSQVGIQKELRFSLTCLKDLGITLNPGDNIEYHTFYALNPDGPYTDAFDRLNNFRAYGFATVDGTDLSCDSYGEEFRVAKVGVSIPEPVSSDLPVGCEDKYISYKVIPTYRGFDKYFGMEYYPSVKVDSIAFTFDTTLLTAFTVFEPEVSIKNHPIYGDAYFPLPGIVDNSNGVYVATFDTLDIVGPLNNTGYAFDFRFHIVPNCKSEYSSSNNNNFYDINATIYLENRFYANFGNRDPNCIENISKQGVVTSINYSDAPQVDFTNISSPNFNLLGDTASWTVKICNTSPDAYTGSTWFSVDNPENSMKILSMDDITDSANIIPLTLVEYGTGNAYAFAGGLTEADAAHTADEYCKTVLIKAEALTCGFLSATAHAGWECAPITVSDWNPSDYAPCVDHLLPITITTEDPALEANITSQQAGSVDLCIPLDFEILLKNTDIGTAYDIQTDLIIPLQGATIVPGSVEIAYPSSAAFVAATQDPTFIEATAAGNVYRYDNFEFLNSFLHANGLDGINTANPTDSNEMKIKFRILTDCDFISGDLAYYSFRGVKGCKSFTNTESGETFPLLINGTGSGVNKIYEVSLTNESLLVTNSNSNVGVKITNKTTNLSSSTTDFVFVKIPSDIVYVANSASAVQPAGWTPGEPTITTANGISNLVWNLPEGLALDEEAILNIQLTVPNYDCDVQTKIFSLATAEEKTFDCGVTQCNSFEITSSPESLSSEIGVVQDQPILNVTSLTSTCSNINEETILLVGNLTAMSDFPADTIVISYFEDVNNDGAVDAGDLMLATFKEVGPILAGQSIPINHSFVSSISASCNILAQVDVSASVGASCGVMTQVLNRPRLLNAGNDILACPDGTDIIETLGAGCSATTYSFEWTAVPASALSYLSATNIENPILNVPSGDVQIDTMIFILSTTGSFCGTTTDSVVLRIQPCPCTPVNITSTTIVEAECGSDNGVATVNIDGDPLDYIYKWTPEVGVAMGNGEQRGNLPAGVYSVEVESQISPMCSDMVTFTVTTKDGSISPFSMTPATCTSSDGSITFDSTSYMYLWFDSSDLSTRNDLASGDYFVTVTDLTKSCTTVQKVTVDAENTLTVEATVVNEPDCNSANGEVNLVVSNGTGTYTYLWADNNTLATRSDLAAGLHTVTVTDSGSGCVKEFTFGLSNNIAKATITVIDTIDVKCFEQNDGGLDFTIVFDPAFVEPADTIFSNGINEFENNQLAIGDYCMTILDGNGCVAGSTCFSISEPDPLELKFVVVPVCETDGSVDVLVDGGTEPYTYDWADITGTDDIANRTFSSADTFDLKVTDVNGCIVQEPNFIVPNCENPCNIVDVDTLRVEAMSCEGLQMVCFENNSRFAFASMDVTVDGVAYTDTYTSCSRDTIHFYTYVLLHKQGQEGPYELQEWVVGTDTFSGNFNNVQELVDLMNTFDPLGDWSLNEGSIRIDGGQHGVFYGQLKTFHPATFKKEDLNYDANVKSVGVKMLMDVGSHEVIIDNKMGCIDTVNVIVERNNLFCSSIIDTIMVHDTVKFCIDTSLIDFVGDTIVMENVCPDTSGESVEFVLDEDFCVTYIGTALGTDTACIQLCDNLGNCDTVNFFITVIKDPNIVIDTIDVNEEVTHCPDTTVLPGNIVLFENFCPDQSGDFVSFALDSNTYCVDYMGVAFGTDTACIRICDDQGFCDTTYYYITVEENIDLPIAVDDIDTTKYETPIILDILGNDFINGSLISIEILENPIYGTVWLNPENSATYNPNSEVCDVTDYFTYKICNENGCDTATVSIYIDCGGKIIIYSGVSPNGDGSNDHFHIGGLQYYPNNNLCIYNRWGNLVYDVDNYKNNWEGTWQNNALPDGTYYYILKLNDEEGSVFSGFMEVFR